MLEMLNLWLNTQVAQAKFQAHLQFAQANAQPKIAKELKTPSHTENHMGFGGKLKVLSLD